MDSTEIEIYNYLKSYPGQLISVLEVCRRAAGRKRYKRDPDWAVPVLARMQENGIVESENGTAFRLGIKFMAGLEARRRRSRWIAPQIKQMFSVRGELSGFIHLENPDEVEWNYLLDHNGV